MRRILSAIVTGALIAAPLTSAGSQSMAIARPGAFVGARFQLPMGGEKSRAPRATLAIAPTQSRISSDGMIRTRIGEGLALNFGTKSGPTITLAGVRADKAFASQSARQLDATKKLGVSTRGWVAIGVGVAVLTGGIYFAYLVHEGAKSTD
jgi:hypothetical protein